MVFNTPEDQTNERKDKPKKASLSVNDFAFKKIVAAKPMDGR